MNHRLHLLAALTALALVGCAPQAPQPAPGVDSPASSEAPESPIPRSETLAVPRSAEAVQGTAVGLQQLKPEVPAGKEGVDHDMPGMKHGTAETPHIAPATKPGENAALSAPRWTPTTVPTSPPSAATVYTCKMHPKVISNTPGECPICGMKLVPKLPASQAAHEDHQHGGQP